MAHPELGKPAPGFSLQDQNGTLVNLTDFAGKNVVVYFYPKAMTPGCKVQACGIRDHKKEFAKANTVVLAISPDPHARLKKFEDKESLNFTLLSDEDHAVADSYGAWGLKKFMGKEYMGILRSTFIVDTGGKLVHVMAKVKTKTHDQDVLDWINENVD